MDYQSQDPVDAALTIGFIDEVRYTETEHYVHSISDCVFTIAQWSGKVW